MFTNLANLLLGATATSAEHEEEDCCPGEAELSVLEAEDGDWLLVEAAQLQRGALLASMAVAPRSRSHSVSALEESWFVTPPPCFNSQGPVELETSPLENLLIEHPSMSVYHRPHHSIAAAPLQQRSASLSPPPRGRRARQPLTAVNPRPPRPLCITLAKQHQQQNAAVQAAQKVQQKVGAQQMRRAALDRNNKARDVGSARNKRPRRCDHQMRHSGANNNRKC
ncbi:tumor protein p53-inducible nuclear protein 2 [Neocloeon triangulifer]|uniref:tumor protein p53-inducible nuclear protein 2 n=1 Tax=Neocloeon triangulifer TaxID=2078957 RepID=UPI00286EF67B|nr:tumor protein p53-inducible nuclear protein 2 [Neocloeon triangulifer]